MLPLTSDHRILTLLVDDPSAQLKFTEQMPTYLLTIPQIVDKFCPQLKVLVEKTDSIKSDGALDDIPLRSEKRVILVKDLLINIRTQRVDNIELTRIQENLKKHGGYKHARAGTIDTFVSKLYGDSSPDGMHRAIMAYICGVKEIAIQRQGEHPVDCSEEEMIAAEREFFIAKNQENAPVKTTSTMRVAKLSGNMSTSQKKLDDACADVNIHVNDYGVSSGSADLVYSDGHSNLEKLLVNEKNYFYMGVKSFKKCIPLLKELKIGRTQLDGAIAYAMYLLDEDTKVLFKMYLRSDAFKMQSKDSWTAKNQHNYAMETAVVRLALRFNEWHKSKFDTDVITFEFFEPFLEKMSGETHHFIHSALIDGNPVDEVLLSFRGEDGILDVTELSA